MEEIILHIENILGQEVGQVSMIEFMLDAKKRQLAPDVVSNSGISGVAILTSLEKELAVAVDHLTVTLELPCPRCTDSAEVILSNITTGERSFLLRIPMELREEEFPEVFPINRSQGTIDIAEMLRQEIVLAIPTQYECSRVHAAIQKDVDDGHQPFAGLGKMLED